MKYMKCSNYVRAGNQGLGKLSDSETLSNRMVVATRLFSSLRSSYKNNNFSSENQIVKRSPYTCLGLVNGIIRNHREHLKAARRSKSVRMATVSIGLSLWINFSGLIEQNFNLPITKPWIKASIMGGVSKC